MFSPSPLSRQLAHLGLVDVQIDGAGLQKFLVGALADIKRLYQGDAGTLAYIDSVQPEVACSPQVSFYAQKESLPIRETAERVCGEFVMCYPPGIPILAPGERITQKIVEYIQYAKEKGCSMTGPEDPDIQRLNVLKGVY